MERARLHLVRLLLVSILMGTGLVIPRPAAAGENDADESSSAGDRQAADQHYGEAVRLFGQGRYREAIEEFDRAITLSPEPVFYCNRGIAFIKINEWEGALDDLRTCRQTYEGSEAEIAQIDAQYQGLRTFVRDVRPRAIEVAQDIASGELAPKVVTVAEPEDPWNVELLGHLSTGTGAVLLTAALTLDYLSGDLRDEFVAESQGGPGTSAKRYRELRDELETRQNVFTGLTISGATLVVTGVSVLTYSWFFADTPDQGDTTGSVSVAPLDGGATLQLHLDF